MSDTNERIAKYKEIMIGKAHSAQIADIIIKKLVELGFFDAPASTKFHGAHEGGLFDHSAAVTDALVNLTDKLGLEWQLPRSPYIVGMYHDLCKCDTYKRTADDFVPYAHNNNTLLNGHGEKSVIVLQQLFAKCGCGIHPLTDEEIACIRWHMGAFDDKTNWDYYSNACSIYPNVLYAHTADMIAFKIVGI